MSRVRSPSPAPTLPRPQPCGRTPARRHFMRQRPFGRTGRTVSELGVGMWGMGGGIGGWSDADDAASMVVLQAAVDAGVTFFDSAQVYGYGVTDRLMGELRAANPDRELFLASKIPPKNREWPALPGSRVRDVFPPDHIRASVAGMLRKVGAPTIDLVQFHVWQDEWADDAGWQGCHGGAPARRARPPRGHQRQPARARERAADAADRPDRLRPGGLQRLRPVARGRAVPAVPGAGRRRDRARAAGRGEPGRGADASTADGPTATGATPTSRRRTWGRRSSGSRRCGRWCRPGSRWPSSPCGSSCRTPT